MTILDLVAEISELVENEPNDMILGEKIRKLLNKEV